jgi:putative membrane protein
MDGVLALFTERPYVVAFLCAFIVIASAEHGVVRMLAWLATGTFIGWLMEFSSTHNGFPFGEYAYNDQNFPDELWLGGVPLFASLSFAFLTYFAYSAACTFLGTLDRSGSDIQRRSAPHIERSLRVLVLAAAITTWMDTVMDPVTHLGEHWFLGNLYAYQGDGQHFDVPLTNYGGWLLTAACIVFVNQRLDTLLAAAGIGLSGFHLPFKPFWAIGTVVGNFAFMIGITVYLIASDSVPSSVPINEILLSGVAISGLFVAFASFMLWRALARSDRSTATQELAYST